MSALFAVPAQSPVRISVESAETCTDSVQVFRADSAHNSHDLEGRWRLAHERAKAAGIRVYELGRGRYAVTSASSPSEAHEVTIVPETCTCPAAAFGDPVCIHRAAVRAHLNPEPEPEAAHQPYDPEAEALQWAYNDRDRAYRDLERYNARIAATGNLNDREWAGFLRAQEREQDASQRIVALKAAQKVQVAA